MRRVAVESPYAGDVVRNVRYARAAIADCLRRGESPYASHLLYTQPGVLSDDVPASRELGIAAGLRWGTMADAAVFYVDFGWSKGMLAAKEAYEMVSPPSGNGEWQSMPIEERRLPDDVLLAVNMGALVDEARESPPDPVAIAIDALRVEVAGYRSMMRDFLETLLSRGIGRGSGG